MLEQTLIFIASFVANTMSAFAGGGSGLVQFPVIIFLGLPFSIALATHKTATFALGLGAIYRYVSKGDPINWGFAAFVMACGLPGTILGAWVILQIPEQIAQLSLGIFTISLGIYSIFKKQLGQETIPKNRDIKGYIIGGGVLFLTGIYNGSFASGSGLFVTMWLVIWFGLNYKSAVMYTMTLVGFLWNATGAIALNVMGSPVYWAWLPALLAGSFLGGYTGAHLGALKGSAWIKRGFEAVTIASGLLLIVKAMT